MNIKTEFDPWNWISGVQYGIKADGDEPEVEEEVKPEGEVEGEPEGETEIEGEAKTEAEPEPKSEPPAIPAWQTRRIDELTRNWREEQRQHAAAKAELEALRRGTPKPTEGETTTPAGPRMYSEEEVNSQAEARAKALAQMQSFDSECNKVYADGKAKFPDFDARLQNFQHLGGLPPALIEAALASGAPSQVLHELGGNMELASQVLALSPVAMAVKVAEMAGKIRAPASVSKVPPPAKIIGGRAKAERSLDDPNLSMDEWVELFDKQQAKANR